MKRLLLFGALGLVVLSFSPERAGAQDTVRRAGVLARSPSYTSLLASIVATSHATQLVTSRNVTTADIRVVDAGTVIGSDNDEPINAALVQQRAPLGGLRTAIAGNVAYTAALAGHRDRPAATDVIAVDILASGDVLVYFRKAP